MPDRNNRTIDEKEVALFDAWANNWWQTDSETRWLHRYNPLRVDYVRRAVCRYFDRDPAPPDCLQGLRILDVGCGAGMLCEPLAALGATMLGIDPAPSSIAIATAHARQTGVKVYYRCTTARTLLDSGERFDVVLASEVIEHVGDSELFLRECAALVAARGLLILSTINRTCKSFAYAIVIGEYVLRTLPVGTHQWAKFRTPDEIRVGLAAAGLSLTDVSGVTFNLMSGKMQLARDINVNYIVTAERIA